MTLDELLAKAKDITAKSDRNKAEISSLTAEIKIYTEQMEGFKKTCKETFGYENYEALCNGINILKEEVEKIILELEAPANGK